MVNHVCAVSGAEFETNSHNITHGEYIANNAWGLSTQVDVKNCNPLKITNPEIIKQYVVELCELIDMKRFGDCMVTYFGADDKVAGHSMVQLIETSLISGHFADETNAAYIDIFSCKYYDQKTVRDFTQSFFEGDSSTFCSSLRI